MFDPGAGLHKHYPNTEKMTQKAQPRIWVDKITQDCLECTSSAQKHAYMYGKF